ADGSEDLRNRRAAEDVEIGSIRVTFDRPCRRANRQALPAPRETVEAARVQLGQPTVPACPCPRATMRHHQHNERKCGYDRRRDQKPRRGPLDQKTQYDERCERDESAVRQQARPARERIARRRETRLPLPINVRRRSLCHACQPTARRPRPRRTLRQRSADLACCAQAFTMHGEVGCSRSGSTANAYVATRTRWRASSTTPISRWTGTAKPGTWRIRLPRKSTSSRGPRRGPMTAAASTHR